MLGATVLTEGFPRGIGEIWLDNVECTGSEESLEHCTRSTTAHDCTHIEDVGVSCPGTYYLENIDSEI